MQTKEVLDLRLALRQLQKVIHAKAQIEQRLALKLEGLANNYEDQQFRMVQGLEDQWSRMAEHMDTTFQDTLFQMSQANLVRLLPWFLSATTKSGAGPTCSVSEALTSVTTSELEGTTAPASTGQPST